MMSKTDGLLATQGKTHLMPKDRARPGQSLTELGKRWGSGNKTRPQTTRAGSSQPKSIPGGLEMAPDKPESQLVSLDQPLRKVLKTDKDTV